MTHKKAQEFFGSLVGRSPATKKLYRIALTHLFEFVKKDPSKVEMQDLQRFLQHLEEEHMYKKNTLRAYVNILRSFLRYIKREDLRKQIKAIRHPKILPTVPTSEEVQSMIGAAGSLRNRMIIQMLARTGLRVGELCNLDVSDIDLQNLRIVIRSRGEWKPKGGKERVVRMDSETAALIQKYVGSRSESRLIDVKSGTIRAMIKRIARRAAIRNAEQMTPHKLRHFFACDFLQRGGDVRSLQKLLGHSELSTTEIYLDYTFDMVSQAYNKVFEKKEGEKQSSSSGDPHARMETRLKRIREAGEKLTHSKGGQRE